MATIIVNSNFQDNGAPATGLTPAQINLNITRISR